MELAFNEIQEKSSIHYRIQHICRVPQALGEPTKTFGKAFAKWCTRQSRVRKQQLLGKLCLPSAFYRGTRQTLCECLTCTGQKKVVWRPSAVGRPLTSMFAKCHWVPSAFRQHSATHVFKNIKRPEKWFFEKSFTECCTRQFNVAECRFRSTLQTFGHLCRVPAPGTRQSFGHLCRVPPCTWQKIVALGKESPE